MRVTSVARTIYVQGGSNMMTRNSSRQVVFSRFFFLAGFDMPQAPGTEALLRDAAQPGERPYVRPSALKRRTSLFRQT